MELKIFANNINHLTDARYFAAWGASWMCYNVRSITITEIAAIRQWVEGPDHIINVIGIDPSEAAAMLSNDVIDGYLTDHPSDHKRIQELLSRDVAAFMIDQEVDNATTIYNTASSNVSSFDGLLCSIDDSPADILTFIQEQNPSGIVLAGSEEEIVGFKSFDELDEILELLEEADVLR